MIGTKLVPAKRLDGKKKTELTDANSSVLQSIAGVPPIDISVNCSRKFCVRESIPSLRSSASKLKHIKGIIAAKKNPDAVIKKKSEDAAKCQIIEQCAQRAGAQAGNGFIKPCRDFL